MKSAKKSKSSDPILVIAASGKTGRRVADLLEAGGHATRRGSRSAVGVGAQTRFDWDQPETWEPALRGARAAYVVYSPDLAVPAAPNAIERFVQVAKDCGVRRLVLLSGRGEEEAQRCEGIVRASGLETTVVRASWFAQNFDEGAFHQPVLSGVVALPAGDVLEPFVDIDDIAEVALAALTEDGHDGEIYEITGPCLMRFADAVDEIAQASGRELRYVQITREDFVAGLREAGLPGGQIELLDFLFTTVLDGRNASLGDGVERALGRPARDFRDFARAAAARDAWAAPAAGGAN